MKRPSIVLSLPDPKNTPLVLALFDSCGMSYVPTGNERGFFTRNPLFSLHQLSEKGGFSFNANDNYQVLDELELLPEDVDTLARASVAVALNEWIALWGLHYTTGLNRLAQGDDGIDGDVSFFALIHIMTLVDEFAGYFLNDLDDEDLLLRRSIFNDGCGLFLAKALHDLGQASVDGWEAPVDNPLQGIDVDDEDKMEALIAWAPAVFAKVLKVAQSPAMDARFKVFFETLAQQLGLDHQEVVLSLGTLANERARNNGSRLTLLQTKVKQVLGGANTAKSFAPWKRDVRCKSKIAARKSLKDLEEAQIARRSRRLPSAPKI